jgi:hypothetical protein
MVKFPIMDHIENQLQIAKSLSFVNQNTDFVAWLRSELARLDAENRVECDVQAIHKRQGACTTLMLILSELDNAERRFRNLKDEFDRMGRSQA